MFEEPSSSSRDPVARTMQGLLGATLRILTFRAGGEELARLGPRHLAFGLFCTWLAGIGRWWDDPGAHLLLHLGLGSVVYVFILSTFLFLIIWPLRPKNWRWSNVVTYVSLTSPPALLYALPVERWTDLHTSQVLNLVFLALVAAWRVVLLARYLRHATELGLGSVIAATALPLMLIITTLTMLNLERGVFSLMAGISGPGATSHDVAYAILLLLTGLSMLGVIPMLLWYLTEIFSAARLHKAVSKDPVIQEAE